MENMHLCNYQHLPTVTQMTRPPNFGMKIYLPNGSHCQNQSFLHFLNSFDVFHTILVWLWGGFETGDKSLLAQAFVHLWELLGLCELPTIRPRWTALPPPSFSCFSRALQTLWSNSVCTGGQTQNQALWFSQCEHGQCHNCGDEKSLAQKSWAVKIGGPWSIVSLVNAIHIVKFNKVQDCCFTNFELRVQFNCNSYVSKFWNFFYLFFETNTIYWGS